MGNSDGINPSELIKELESTLAYHKGELAKAKLGSDKSNILRLEEHVKEDQLQLDNAKAEYGGAARKQQAISTAKNIGSKTVNVVANAGEKTADIIKNAGSATLNGLRNAGRAIGGSGDSSSSSSGSNSSGLSGLQLIFWFAVVIHIIDVSTGTQRPGIVLSAYMILFIYSTIFIFKSDRSSEVGLLIAIIAAYSLPWLTKTSFIATAASSTNWALLLKGLIVFIPIIPVYLAFKFPDHTWIQTWAKWVIAFWLIVFALFAVSTYLPNQNTKILNDNPMAGITYAWNFAGKSVGGLGTTINNAFERAVAEATGQPYDGQEESRVGIYVENVKPLETGYTTNSNVYVEAKIQAVNVKEPVKVTTLCYIPSIHEGKTNPYELFEVSGNYENIIDCELGQLKAGTYEVRVRATFEFESTSDISYTFVSTNIKTDQYARLDINPTTIATYTGGPVAVGLPSISQPLRIDTIDEGKIVSYPFGVSLQNKWPQGKIMKGINYTLNTPKEVKLSECNRPWSEATEPNAEGRNIYVFKINTTNAQDVFDAVRCRMQINDVKSLLGNDLKSVKTFAARATYEYSVEGSTTIVIMKN